MFTKKYFQDRPLLFLNLVVVFGALINVVTTALRINTSQSIAIIRYQVNLGLAGFQRASNYHLYTFTIAAVLIAVMGILLSARLFNIKRSLSVLVLALTIIALVFNLIVSWAVLNLQ
ncbi:hypothetical protein KBB76_02440 [Candidatus Saccharibacteria bacterium]|jgi:hypothetical protein|nr:hypothetical protein [Candidatus Saccharibacteria bacterium]HPW48217.1 hypothetical protein [Candidatus Saccharibacteria bacterium]